MRGLVDADARGVDVGDVQPRGTNARGIDMVGVDVGVVIGIDVRAVTGRDVIIAAA